MLDLELEARAALWRPEGDDGPELAVAAFGEAGGAPSTPGPLVRVPAGTEVRVAVRNRLQTPITVYGLDGAAAAGGAGVTIPPGAERSFHFRASTPGLTYYWARTSAGANAPRFHDDSQLHGAIVVDPPFEARAARRPTDRIFVISSWFTRDTSTMSGLGPHATLALNGRSWPHTERIAMTQGDSARWRVVNASLLTHPMHLHGAYFRVEARGDARQDTVYTPDSQRLAVTEVLGPGQTMAMTWTPVEPGNWLFHCHFASHFAPRAAFEADRRTLVSPAGSGHGTHGMRAGGTMSEHMEGLVLGVTVRRRGRMRADDAPARPIRLTARSRANVYGPYVGYGYVLGDAPAAPDAGPLTVPGPVLSLVRGERVAVTLVNRAHEPMAVHWHGIELESYADGVPGWSGEGPRTLPLVAPGDSLVVRFTPPRAGTFMYHAHSNDMQQVSSGLYGAIVVSERGAPRDPAADHLVVVSDAGPLVDFFGPSPPALVNGSDHPAPMPLAAGRVNRLRLINIRTEQLTTLTLWDGEAAAEWRVVAKDGAALPPSRIRTQRGTLRFAPGEIVDVEVDARAGRPLTLRWTGGPGDPRSIGALALPVR